MTTSITRKLRSDIPQDHRTSSDTRLEWLWSQRLIVVQNIWLNTTDILDRMAASLVITATMSNHLPSIELYLKRLEGGPVSDEAVVEEGSLPI